MNKGINTGHRDCCGEAIREGDKVVTVSGEGAIEWDGSAWKIHYLDGHLEPLNCYDQSRIRRWDNTGQSRDNRRDNGTMPRDNQNYCPTIVP